MSMHARILCLLAAALAAPAQALDADRQMPFQMDAAKVEIDQKTGTAVYRGNVVMSQGSLRIEADKVVGKMEKGQLTTVTATGKPVKVRALLEDSDQELLANAQRIVFRANTRELELTGEAWVRQGANEFRAQQIRYALDEQRLQAIGKDAEAGRVHAVFHPPKDDAK
jgi:lipopolysaccharide export system protein LptA